MQSSDPRHFFETDATQAKRERKVAKSNNKYGNPIALKSKLLAAVLDPTSPATVFVAESAGSVRRVNLDVGSTALIPTGSAILTSLPQDGSVKSVYKGPTAPVTCVAVGGEGNKTVFAGSWDRNISSWNIETKVPVRQYTGHSDFVKSIVCTRISGKEILISGGADKKIIVWDISTGVRLHTLQDNTQNMLAIQDLAVDPVQSTPDEAFLVSASSDPHIRRWKVRLDGWEQVVDPSSEARAEERRTILEHETTVYKLVFDYEGDEVDLWTSSADGTSKCLTRMSGFASDDEFKHGDHVRAVAVTDQWVITAGRDENLKLWDRASGRLYCSLEGHYDEVTSLVVLRGPNKGLDRLCSTSLDGTIRLWSLAKPDVDAMVKEQQQPKNLEEQDEKKEGMEGMLTAEEEAELAALMDED
ncbi:uncharacterized protein E0L32_008801 [Thyridium curvatum]|uniref:Uncharacterized protein n=1 Tax=Thyridium curvatum TaxID=1093900 RepID=A0A507ATY2_9PEZI|nr:uncharacterized protein E0L32_008801 [Thyridium curvatum]TPX09954.1 hypothetical protein E0L32_008801 [Thyridium curvatum]